MASKKILLIKSVSNPKAAAKKAASTPAKKVASKPPAKKRARGTDLYIAKSLALEYQVSLTQPVPRPRREAAPPVPPPEDK